MRTTDPQDGAKARPNSAMVDVAQPGLTHSKMLGMWICSQQLLY